VRRSLTLDAPAKLNLGLRVVGRRDDGYHLLEGLFVPVTLSDVVTLDFDAAGAPNIHLVIEGASPDVPVDAANLAVAAAHAFFGPSPGGALRIGVDKRIPSAAGLGGGSSDAAAVLRGLAQLAPETRSPEELARLALGLGADVPFFLDPRPALVRGVGEVIEPIPGLPPLWAVLANPGIAVSTAEVFRLYDSLGPRQAAEGVSAGLTPPDPGSTLRALFELDGEVDTLARLSGFANDLEAAAIRLCPPVSRLQDRMRELGAVAVGMSGSGATVYGLFGSRSEAEGAFESAGFETPTWSQVTRFLV
jgi:4-diphosphocytidyl-2-C-methyl-D-erythritol kinase